MLKLVHDATADAVGEADLSTVDLDELCRLAAKEMLAVTLLAERRAYLEAHADEVDAAGHRLVVGNGYARPRVVTTGAGAIEVRAPRIDDRREGCRFSSAILPAYMRKSPKVTEVLPVGGHGHLRSEVLPPERIRQPDPLGPQMAEILPVSYNRKLWILDLTKGATYPPS